MGVRYPVERVGVGVGGGRNWSEQTSFFLSLCAYTSRTDFAFFETGTLWEIYLSVGPVRLICDLRPGLIARILTLYLEGKQSWVEVGMSSCRTAIVFVFKCIETLSEIVF